MKDTSNNYIVGAVIALMVGVLIGATLGLHVVTNWIQMTSPYPTQTEYVQVKQ